MKERTLRANTNEAKLMYDLSIRTEKLFERVRAKIGTPELSYENGIKWISAFERLVINNADFLEQMSIELEMSHLYQDSSYLVQVREKNMASSVGEK